MRNIVHIINRITFFAAICFFIFLAQMSLSCAEANELSPEISGIGENIAKRLTDANYNTYNSISENASFVISCGEDMGSIYIVFDRVYGEFTLTDVQTGKSVRCGEGRFLHTYLDVRELLDDGVRSVRLDFDSGEVSLADIYVFGEGEVPSWVQRWEKTVDGNADLLLLSSHSDDEQLFFAGILPYYAGELGLKVQVVYFTNHFDTHNRPHEQLNGLWTVGVKNYPVVGELPDLYSESLSGALSQYKWVGYAEEDIVGFQVEMIRRFKPLVVVGHDVNGEYGHGTHRLNTDTLMSALELSSDASSYAESAKKYGTWNVPKTYLHLWDENKIVMDWDTPLENFGGRTAFEMSIEGYGCHLSQHWTWFTRWLKGTDAAPISRASEIKTYSPCEYGLYRTTVGADVEKKDFFENISLKNTESDTENMKKSEKMHVLAPASPQAADQNFGKFGNAYLIWTVVLFICTTFVTSALFIWLFRKRIFKNGKK